MGRVNEVLVPNVAHALRDCTEHVAVHLQNSYASWDGGLAKALVTGPEAHKDWIDAMRADECHWEDKGEPRFGSFSISGSLEERAIVNLYGQLSHKDPASLAETETALRKFLGPDGLS